MSNLTIGKIANNSMTLVLCSSDGSDGSFDNFDFEINVPNIAGFPHKTRCLLQVQSIELGTLDILAADATGKAFNNVIGVKIDGLSSMTKVFSNGGTNSVGYSAGSGAVHYEGYVGILPFRAGMTPDLDNGLQGLPSQYAFGSLTYATDGDILNHGVLCESPFGKRLRIQLVEF